MRPKRALLLLLAAAVLAAAGWILARGVPPPSPPPTPSLPAETVAVGGAEVILYFADAESALLTPVHRRLTISPVSPEALLQELIAGPTPAEKGLTALPKGTRLLGTSLAGGILTVNFNRAFQKNFPSSSAASLLAIYSIVNTLTELPGIDKVAFQIEGQPVSELGPLDVSEPLTAKPDMIVARFESRAPSSGQKGSRNSKLETRNSNER